MAKPKGTFRDALEAAKVEAPPPEDGTPEEAVAAAQAAGVSSPGVPAPPSSPPADPPAPELEEAEPAPPPRTAPSFRVEADKTFSLRGQMVTWKAGRVVVISDEATYHRILDAGVKLTHVGGG